MPEKIGKYFSRHEFACQGSACCDNSAPVTKELVMKLDSLREKIGPIVLTSAYRCLVHNRTVGSNDKSQHPKGYGI